MQLKSLSMNLSPAERRWLPWFGATGKLAMGRACFRNRKMYPVVEQTFEGIAATRKKLLQLWARNQWDHMAGLAETTATAFPEVASDLLQEKRRIAPDFSELFVVDCDGQVVASSHSYLDGAHALDRRAVQEGLKAPFLHGPYSDRRTLELGPSSSRFHDAVTLMFYQPIERDGEVLGCVCGRVPNDVLGDLIQREAGHIYPESGDNYLFMVESRFDPSIQPGTALSRSRFEDDTFAHGENLKSGIHTKFGTVQVQNHTELELRFTDPATGQLHPGVRETMRKGENLFITYPGYSDYRHFPVIGKGVTFQLPGSPDRWGMMCEGDLEEVYRRRSVSNRLMRLYLGTVLLVVAPTIAVQHLTDLSAWAVDGVSLAMLLFGSIMFYRLGPARLSGRLNQMTDVIRTIAEGEGNLRQRLDTQRMAADETGDMGRWINSFIDNLDGIVGQVIEAADEVRQTNSEMLERNAMVQRTSSTVSESAWDMLSLVEAQLEEIQRAASTAEQMKATMDRVVAEAKGRFESVRAGTQAIRDVVDTSAKTVHSLDNRTTEIGKIVQVITEIADQTNLLALNAAIEAARAGEHGRGFSVVAEEVRSLAGRTATATHDIRTMIEGIQRETQQAVGFMENGVKDVDNSLKLAEDASSDNSGLHDIVQEMFGIIKEIDESGQQHGNTVRSVADVTTEMNQEIDGLKNSSELVGHTANKLHQLVGQFQVTSR
ncbi:methyl-accepting chemotaxis protein [Guyparkeria halophila]|uniref:Methyl-accepting chemotaxis protein n=1 Tax=Guyparkeria halophila TaxID=47960 RepID=A0A6I6CW73_9GAMM|nr:MULTISPECIES: methyl-accepting chemotaxis protein [Guyparkeria]QGT78359.1 methyl-accepting chemotaxis protein [Guyparkeria halophila]TKA89616.1 methyl-accepting chemotaxis protein [Guyparkeria sp. SB14A]